MQKTDKVELASRCERIPLDGLGAHRKAIDYTRRPERE